MSRKRKQARPQRNARQPEPNAMLDFFEIDNLKYEEFTLTRESAKLYYHWRLFFDYYRSTNYERQLSTYKRYALDRNDRYTFVQVNQILKFEESHKIIRDLSAIDLWCIEQKDDDDKDKVKEKAIDWNKKFKIWKLVKNDTKYKAKRKGEDKWHDYYNNSVDWNTDDTISNEVKEHIESVMERNRSQTLTALIDVLPKDEETLPPFTKSVAAPDSGSDTDEYYLGGN